MLRNTDDHTWVVQRLPGFVLTPLGPLYQQKGGDFMLLHTLPATVSPTTGDALQPVTTSVGMLFACWAIVIVLLAMFIVFMRAGQKPYALAILPLVIVPFIHIVSGAVARFLDPSLPLTGIQIRAVIDTAAALISCLLVGAMSRGIPQRRVRNGLSVGCSAFVIVLTLVLLISTLTGK